ncbi:hypothetical protein ONZ43_g1334 [Nemania bipapillata]|uniref:Uncharacterized protein n=1 Tax=Nemania bipapillata TaxID=110536 RepID=A0ACC2J568_9PEZI|nr:hypothetical protein ONZ43_g1334 [Nemania bipapillata]
MSSATKTSRPLTWLITGSSSGFGLALARLAQSKGHNVIATSRNPDRTPELVNEVVERGGRWIQLDLDDLESGKIIEDLEAGGTAIDVLINTAAMSISGPLESFTEAEVRRQMDTNFFGPYRLIRAVTPYMRKRRSGMIVNFSSGAGLEAMNSLGVYGASKAALDDMTKVLHKELEPFNVRVLLVYLGTFDTPMSSSVQTIAAPLDSDYEGTQTERLFNMLRTGNFALPGDHVKASQAVYDVIMDEGFANGLGNEIMLALGSDLAITVKRTQDRLAHMMDVFGGICHSVNRDDGTQASW